MEDEEGGGGKLSWEVEEMAIIESMSQYGWEKRKRDEERWNFFSSRLSSHQ